MMASHFSNLQRQPANALNLTMSSLGCAASVCAFSSSDLSLIVTFLLLDCGAEADSADHMASCMWRFQKQVYRNTTEAVDAVRGSQHHAGSRLHLREPRGALEENIFHFFPFPLLQMLMVSSEIVLHTRASYWLRTRGSHIGLDHILTVQHATGNWTQQRF